MDVLCTDKTGTLTEDKIALVKYVNAEGAADERIFDYAYISSNFRSGFKNPLDGAVKAFKKFDVSGFQKVDEIPFDYQRKRDSIIVKTPKGHELVSKGAPEEMFATCGYYQTSDNKLTAEVAKKLEVEYQNLSKDGFRVLAVAHKVLPEKKVYDKFDEKDLIILGFIAFLDPPKKSVSETLRVLESYGIAIKIITGDNEICLF
jgi:Mg2+-importing ATPase